ncbi:CHAT domain-containing protein [Saccharopolyspora taberi]|uniref:CHAT domain-containing protein n=1 Tax=Saccharopolyspora taberi TaxID=60895 RepID=A0ABN3VJ50_9PSEU
MRYDRVGDLTDLDNAIADRRAVAESMPGDAPDREIVLLNLTRDLNTRFERTGEITDLDEALQITRDIVTRTPPDHAELATRLTGLGRALLLRADAAPDVEVLDEAVDVSRAAVEATPSGHRELAERQSNLSLVLLLRFIRTQSIEDIDEATRIGGLAAAGSADSDPRRARLLYTAAQVRASRLTVTRRDDDLDEVIDLYQAAAQDTSGPATIRIPAAVRWGAHANEAGRYDTAVAGFTEALDLLPRAAWVGASRATREHALRMWQGLASASAAAALSAGEPERAVTLLEQGRSVLWAQALGLRDDFAALATADRELADRLRTLAVELDAGEDDRERRIRHADEWDTLLARARTLPGMTDLLRTPTFKKLSQGLGEHPVVIVNLFDTRCDALIVTHGRVTVVELPNVFDAAHARADAYLAARATLDRPGATPLDRAAANQTVLATLEWLWDNIAEPVLAELAPPNRGELPRIIWCPTGPLTVLPLHAAGYHDELDGRTVLDRAVSSYVPTLQALAKARQPVGRANGRALVVAMPTTENLPPPPGARKEADLIGAYFAARHTSRVGEQATRAEVLNDLRSHAYVHFACHGGLRVDDPSAGALYLHDGPLTVLDVAALELTDAEFAFLSACQTAVGSVDLLDESIHMASALQLVGYRQVIATLWTIADQQAPYIARRVYDLISDGDRLDLTRTTRALHQVVRELRDAYPGDPSRWASYIHTGP